MSGLVLPSQRGDEPLLPPPSARSVLLTVVGEMMQGEPEGAWTTALLHVFGGLGVEDHAGRQVLARAAAAGWIERERVGRAVRWRLAPRGEELVREGVRRSEAYLSDRDDWDGRWLVLHVSVPQQQRTTRKQLYGGLTWLGMGNPTPGVWVSPHTERIDELTRLVADLSLEDTSLAFVGSICDAGIREDVLVERAWDLSDLEERYSRFLKQEANAPEPEGADGVLLSFLDLLNLQQRFMRLDPQLPEVLLPDWIGHEGAALFGALRGRWSRPAHARFRELVRAHAPG